MTERRPAFILFATVLLVCACWAPPAGALAPAGGGFFWQSPQPFGWNVYRLAFADAEHVWGIAEGDRFVFSNDAGLTWSTVDPGVRGSLWGLTFPDALHGRAVSSWWDDVTETSHAVLVLTDDGGATWSSRPIDVARFYLYDAAFATADKGWLVGYGWDAAAQKSRPTVLTTTDAGQTWQPSPLPGTSPDDLTAIDAMHLWMTSGSRGVATSPDGGASWTLHHLAKGTGLYGICPVDATHAWALVYGKAWPRETILKTSDGGATWSKAGELPEDAWGSLVAASPSEAWISARADWGANAGAAWVQHTVDGGVTWTRSYVGPRAVGSLVAGAGGLMLGTGAGIWRSPDAGATWLRVVGGGGDFWVDDVCAAGPSDLWAVGETTPSSGYSWNIGDGFGLLFHSTDGASWRQVDLPLGAPLHTVAFSDGRHGWAAGAAEEPFPLPNRLLRTVDGGATWTPQPAAADLSFTDIVAIGEQGAAAIAWDGQTGSSTIVTTSDGGASWQRSVRPDDVYLSAICALSPMHLLVAGQLSGKTPDGMLLESVDGGVTWTGRLLGLEPWVRDMTFVDAAHGWILASDSDSFMRPGRGGNGSAVLRTSDGGVTWQKTDLGHVSAAGLTSLAFSDATHGWAVGDMVLLTSDGGVTWQDAGVDVPRSASMREVPVLFAAACSGGEVWVVGAGETIISTRDTTADTAAPVTGDDGERLWRNTEVTIHLRAFDGGSGVARTEYRIDGTPAWTTGTDITFGAPIDHLGDGRHTLTYRSIDLAGNVESASQCPVLVDTTAPLADVRAPRQAVRGTTALLRVRVDDELSPLADVTLKLFRWEHGAVRVYQSKHLGLVETDELHNVRVRYTVPKGGYYWEVSGTDLAGNPVDEWRSSTARVVVQ